jgi:hypothetical protein
MRWQAHLIVQQLGRHTHQLCEVGVAQAAVKHDEPAYGACGVCLENARVLVEEGHERHTRERSLKVIHAPLERIDIGERRLLPRQKQRNCLRLRSNPQVACVYGQ